MSDSIQDTITPKEPRLPPDLERVIFELTALNDRGSIPLLMQVAHRVRLWLGAIRYKTVVLRVDRKSFDDDNELVAHFYHSCQPPSSYLHHVRHLSIIGRGVQEDYSSAVVSRCANLQDLHVKGGATPAILSALTEVIHSPHRTVSPRGLLRFSGNLPQLWSDRQVDFTHEVLKDLTHLDLDGFGASVPHWKDGNNFACLKNLRYLAFADLSCPDLHDIVWMCLKSCEALEAVIVYQIKGGSEEEKAFEDKLPKVRERLRLDGTVEKVLEDRVVIFTYDDLFAHTWSWTDDWVRGATGGRDNWASAEGIIKRRREDKEQLL